MSHLKLQSSKAWVQCHKSQRKGLGLWCYFHQSDLPFIPWTLLEANDETCMTSLHACHDLGFVTVCGGCNRSHTLTTSITPASMKSPREKLSKEGRHCFKTNTVKGCWSSLSCREKPWRQSDKEVHTPLEKGRTSPEKASKERPKIREKASEGRPKVLDLQQFV